MSRLRSYLTKIIVFVMVRNRRRSRNCNFCSEEKCDMVTLRKSSLEGRRVVEGKKKKISSDNLNYN